jgi:hypothetical protein
MELLNRVVQGQEERNVLDISRNGYLSKMKVMTHLLERVPALKTEALEVDENGNAKKYTGKAQNIFKLKLPVSVDTAQKLFALLSIDPTLPRKRKRIHCTGQAENEDNEVEEVEQDGNDEVEEPSEAANVSNRSSSSSTSSPSSSSSSSSSTTSSSTASHSAVLVPVISTTTTTTAATAGSSTSPLIIAVGDGDEFVNPAKDYATVSAQTYQNYKSALKWFHEYNCVSFGKVGVVFPAEVDKACKAAIASYKRDIGSKKRRGVMKQKEGMSQFSAFGYQTLNLHLMNMKPEKKKRTWNEGIFASNFQKMSVNTIGRSDNVDDVILSLMDWENDAMTTKFGTTKSDQSGVRTSSVKRLYSNPFAPEFCVVFDTAVYTWCKRRTSEEECFHLYDGENQNQRYYNILMDSLKNIPANIDLGCSRAEIGTHSCRKFAESYAASKVDGPTKTHVALRAGQSVGRTQDCYLVSEEEGDAITGRTLAMLKLTADEFDVLPPHFSPATLTELHGYGWDNILPGYSHYPESFQRVIKMLFASLVYHWYQGHVHRLYAVGHPIFAQPIFTDLTHEIELEH